MYDAGAECTELQTTQLFVRTCDHQLHGKMGLFCLEGCQQMLYGVTPTHNKVESPYSKQFIFLI